jgi:glycosyltransferase involved in cell wall biosynthesis
MTRRILFVAATIDADLGGIARSVPALANALTKSRRDEGTEVCFLAPKAIRDTLHGEFKIEGNNVCLFDGIIGVKRKLEELTRDLGEVDFLYHAGVWNSLNHFVARLGRRRGIPVVVSTRSMLDPWALNHRKWKKRLAWWAYARRDLLRAAAIHATAELEAGYVRKALGKRCPPVIVVPNGVELPGEDISQRRKDAKQSVKRLLFLSRIHEKKGVLDLVKAFGGLDPDGWELAIAGNDDGGHEAACKKLAALQPNAERIRFHGPVKDWDKWELYRSADLFVLPSYSENFGIVVGEALGMGVPVVTTTATPWGEFFRTESRRDGDTEEAVGLWVVETGVEAIKEAMREAMELSDAEREKAGRKGAEWIRREFSWEAIGKQFLEEVGKVISLR